MPPVRTIQHLRRYAALAPVVVTALLLSGCGGSSGGSAAPAGGSTQGSQNGGAQSGPGGQGGQGGQQNNNDNPLTWTPAPYAPFGNGPNTYFFTLPGFQWVNIDKFWNDPRPKTTITCLPDFQDNHNVDTTIAKLDTALTTLRPSGGSMKSGSRLGGNACARRPFGVAKTTS